MTCDKVTKVSHILAGLIADRFLARWSIYTSRYLEWSRPWTQRGSSRSICTWSSLKSLLQPRPAAKPCNKHLAADFSCLISSHKWHVRRNWKLFAFHMKITQKLNTVPDVNFLLDPNGPSPISSGPAFSPQSWLSASSLNERFDSYRLDISFRANWTKVAQF